MAETKTNTDIIPTTNSGDPEEVDSVYHVILNDDLKNQFIEWLKDKNQEAVLMDKDVDTNNTWKNNDAFFGIGEYPIVKKKPTWRDRLLPKEQGNFFLGGREYPESLIPTAANNLALEAKEQDTKFSSAISTPAAARSIQQTPPTRSIVPLTLRSRSAPLLGQQLDRKIKFSSSDSGGESDGGRRKKRSRRKKKAIKKRTRKRN